MAKTSAKSKGYRKTVKKKPFLTKKEILALVAIVAAIVLVVVLFNLFYDDGTLRKGEVQPTDVVAFASRDTNNRYVKLAELGTVEGFTHVDPSDPDTPSIIHTFTPDEETDHISAISLSGSFLAASDQVTNSTSALTSYGGPSLVFTPEQTTTVQGRDAYVYSYTYNYYSEEVAAEAETSGDAETADEAEAPAETDTSAESETPASNCYCQTLGLYVDMDGYSLCFHIYREGADDSFYLPEDQIVDYLLDYADGAFTVYDRTAK